MKAALSLDELERYYEMGAEAKPQMLSRTIVRRCYYDWLKKDSDTRSWEEVFAARLEKYKLRYEKEAAKRSTFVPREIGSLMIENQTLIIKNEIHEKITISRPCESNNKWMKKTADSYAKKYCCSIDSKELLTTGFTKIYTKVWI